MLVILFSSWGGILPASIYSCVTVNFGFVYLTFFLLQSRCTFAVAMDLGRKFRTFFAVSPGKVANILLSMDRIHVVVAVLKQLACSN